MTADGYAAYRPSRLGWVDELPRAWGESRLSRLSHIYAGGTPDRTRLDYWHGGTIPWVNSGAVNQGRVTEPSALITTEAFTNSSTRWVKAGALIIALAGQGKTKGMVAQMGIDATCNQSMAAIEPTSQVDSRYLYWWLSSNYRNLRNMGGGDLRDGLNLMHVGSIPVPLPPLAEQRQIADYLDAQTAKIDALIGKQEGLIKTLAERRQAVIGHAVTKGLDPNAPMRESGVDWLPPTPVGWSTAPLKSVATVVGRIGFRGYTTEDIVAPGDGAITLGPSNLVDSRLFLDESTYISWEKYEESPEIMLTPGDIVVVKTGSSMGKIAAADHSSDVAVTINPQLAIIKPHSCSSAYLLYSLSTDRALAEFRSRNAGGSIPTMTQRTIGNVDISLPPITGQAAIVAYLDRETSKIDALLDKARGMIDVLKERRQALISAAVTGKIDVRGLA